MKDCQNGQDETVCSSTVIEPIVIFFTTSGLVIATSVCPLFLIRRWRRNRRLQQNRIQREGAADIDVGDPTGRSTMFAPCVDSAHPIAGRPPPCYPDNNFAENLDGITRTTEELPPPYMMKTPSNEGPKSVLPTYQEATSHEHIKDTQSVLVVS